MSDATKRHIGGLRPRNSAPNLERLIKANREEIATPEADARASEQLSVPNTPGVPKVTGSKTSVTIYLASALRERSRAAFTATRHLEHDTSYSEMISKAVEAEVTRREAQYNNGAQFAGGDGGLPAGRPLS